MKNAVQNGIEECSNALLQEQLPYESPRNGIETKIAEIWASVLGVNNVGVNDNFLLLGGESLLANQVASRVRDHFGVELSLRSIFVATVAEIAAEIAAATSVCQNEKLLEQQPG